MAQELAAAKEAAARMAQEMAAVLAELASLKVHMTHADC
jgi:hypothetical protein